MSAPIFDPGGLATEAISQRRSGKTASFDWIDAFLLFGGLLTQVVLTLLVADRVPAVEANISNTVLLSRGAVFAFAPIFGFGPLMIRRRMFPLAPAQRMVLRQGVLFRVTSIIGLMLVAFGMVCMGILSSAVARPEGESYEAFRQRVGAEMADLTDLQGIAVAEEAMRNDQPNTNVQQVGERGASWAHAQREARIDAQWAAHQQWRSAQDARATARQYNILLAAVVAFGVGALLLRLRAARPSVAAPPPST
jgi:hypothetical protein